VVVTVRDTEAAPDAVVALWKDLGLPRMAVDVFAPDEVGAVVRRALGGDVSSSLVDDLVRLSHGNPLLLRELVTAAVGSGALDQRDGVWVAAGPLVAPDDLPSTIAARLDRLAPRLRAGAELVAFAEPVGAAVIEELLDADVRGSRSGIWPPAGGTGPSCTGLRVVTRTRPRTTSSPRGWPKLRWRAEVASGRRWRCSASGPTSASWLPRRHTPRSWPPP
jgi:hypothetical protein